MPNLCCFETFIESSDMLFLFQWTFNQVASGPQGRNSRVCEVGCPINVLNTFDSVRLGGWLVMRIKTCRFATPFLTGTALHTSPQRLHIPPTRIADFHFQSVVHDQPNYHPKLSFSTIIVIPLIWVEPKLSSASLSFPSLVHAFSPILVKWNEHWNEIIVCSFQNVKLCAPESLSS